MTLVAQAISQSLFSPTAWDVILHSRKIANDCRSIRIGTEHILASISKSDTPEGEALRECGATYEQIMPECTIHTTPGVKPRNFNTEEVESNFEPDARRAIKQAIYIARERMKKEANIEAGVAELFEVLRGIHKHGDELQSRRILDKLGVNQRVLYEKLCLLASSI